MLSAKHSIKHKDYLLCIFWVNYCRAPKWFLSHKPCSSSARHEHFIHNNLSENILWGIYFKHVYIPYCYEKCQCIYHNFRNYASTAFSIFIEENPPPMLDTPCSTLNVSYHCIYSADYNCLFSFVFFSLRTCVYVRLYFQHLPQSEHREDTKQMVFEWTDKSIQLFHCTVFHKTAFAFLW